MKRLYALAAATVVIFSMVVMNFATQTIEYGSRTMSGSDCGSGRKSGHRSGKGRHRSRSGDDDSNSNGNSNSSSNSNSNSNSNRRNSNDNSSDDNSNRSGDDSNGGISSQEACRIALERVPGEVFEVEFKNKNGRRLYEVYIRKSNGDVYEVKVDAANGDVLKIERDD
ncbi:MAG: PepSY domain-containing protein [Pyrinomonadaceae bacterium]